MSNRSPEAVVTQFIELLDAGERAKAHELYHSEALLDELSYKEREVFSRGDSSIAEDTTRIRNDGDKVVLRFDWQLNGSQTSKAYELRTDEVVDGSWRLFNNREELIIHR